MFQSSTPFSSRTSLIASPITLCSRSSEAAPKNVSRTKSLTKPRWQHILKALSKFSSFRTLLTRSLPHAWKNHPKIVPAGLINEFSSRSSFISCTAISKARLSDSSSALVKAHALTTIAWRKSFDGSPIFPSFRLFFTRFKILSVCSALSLQCIFDHIDMTSAYVLGLGMTLFSPSSMRASISRRMALARSPAFELPLHK
mmetsp:Transcript_97693/g.281904  ORF Transcript_97693/g.281904 Transcript_97693/m.281904 type:complete len:200 (-) Transcript_97693:2421-3020(-)